jgi:hypothetical protein
MTELHEVTWAAGLFEGEGCFVFNHSVAQGVTIQMTDLDVLEKVQGLFGGSILSTKKQHDHHRDTWRWYLRGYGSIEFVESILPHLCGRRAKRGREYLLQMRARKSNREGSRDAARELRLEIKKLRGDGLTHQQIADKVNRDRTYVTHVLSGRYDK